MIQPFFLHDEDDYFRALDLIEALWDAAPGSEEEQVLDVMADRIVEYERAQRTLLRTVPIAP